MKSTTTILLALLSVGILCQQPPAQGCSPGCSNCQFAMGQDNGLSQQMTPKCKGCYGSFLVDGQCTPIDYTYTKCLQWGVNNNGGYSCQWCENGYALSEEGLCIPHTIDGCVFAKVIGSFRQSLTVGQQPPSGPNIQCYVCNQSWPSTDFKSCGSNLQQQVNPCLWGLRSPNTESESLGQQPPVAKKCAACRQGYSVDPNKNECVSSTVPGCRVLTGDLQKCADCHLAFGWFMKTPGNCATQ